MDFQELEATEGLRWSWNSWPCTRAESSSLIIPLSILCTPLMSFQDLPVLPYDPLICSKCGGVLNPYSRVDYTTRIWVCPFCYQRNPFPRSYAGIGENNLPAELFPTYSAVEYSGAPRSIVAVPSNFGMLSSFSHDSFSGLSIHSGLSRNWNDGASPSSSFGNADSFFSDRRFNQNMGSGSNLNMMHGRNNLGSSGSVSGVSVSSGDGWSGGPGFVFVVDVCMNAQELRAVQNELLLVIEQLPETALVGLVTFDSMVRVHDLGFMECSRVVVFHGERELSSEQIRQFLGIRYSKPQQLGKMHLIQKQGYLLPVSECEFSITSAIEEIHCSAEPSRSHRPLRCTGAAISIAVGLLEGCLMSTGSRVMVFTSGPATLGPGIVVNSDLGNSIRTHRDLMNGYAPYYAKSCSFYKRLSSSLCSSSIVLDLFACSLDQVGAAELKFPIENSGGSMMLGESFESNEFRKCLRSMFSRDGQGNLKMYFDVTIEVVTTQDVKICGAIGPCVSLHKTNSLVSENVIGEGGTYVWKVGNITNKTCIAFFFQICDEQRVQPGSAFFVQFITRYRYDNYMTIRKRVTTAARRWVGKNSSEINAGFDQEAAATVMARLAVQRAETCYAREVIRWLDDALVRFASKFGDYIQEDPSTFCLSSNFSLYPQFMYHLRRSQFIDVFNSTPDETAFFRLMLNREGLVGSLIMIQPTLFEYSFDGPPVPVLLDVRSISPDVILLFDSFFYVVIHYGSKIAQWKKLGFDKDPSHETLRKLLEAPEIDAEQLIAERVPPPKLIKCNQHSSQARFLLAKLNPSVTQNSTYTDGSDVILTDDLSLQVFIEHLQALAVQG